MSEFRSLGDGIFSSKVKISSSSKATHDRLYPSLFESDEESPDSDGCSSISGTSVSEARSTPPFTKQKNFLFPVNDFVDHLRPEEVRWFYRSTSEKLWHSFIGYDSLRIECRYRALLAVNEDEDVIDNDVIAVRGGLYEVDVAQKICTPVYWSGWCIQSLFQCIERDLASITSISFFLNMLLASPHLSNNDDMI